MDESTTPKSHPSSSSSFSNYSNNNQNHILSAPHEQRWSTPEVFTEDIEINAKIVDQERFVPERPEDQEMPTAEEVAANNEKWKYIP